MANWNIRIWRIRKIRKIQIKLKSRKAVNKFIVPRKCIYSSTENRHHFGQAATENSPFIRSIMQIRFYTEAELVLAGEYDKPELEQLIRFFLNNLSRVKDLDSQPTLTTLSDLKGKFKVWCEGTSTSPPWRHLGHFNLLFRNINHSLEEEERE